LLHLLSQWQLQHLSHVLNKNLQHLLLHQHFFCYISLNKSEDTCLYKRIFLDYTYNIGKIYTAEEIEKAKQSPSFEREYNLKYLAKIGNVFHTKDIEAAIEKGRKYNPDNFNPSYYSFTSRSMGIDPAYGSSAFGIVVTQWEDDHIQIMHAEEYHRPDYNEILSTVYGLISKYQVDKIYIIDGRLHQIIAVSGLGAG
jgi:hypothetical protein